MIITEDTLNDILIEDQKRKALIEKVEMGYSWLAAKCAFAMGGFGDKSNDEEEDDEDEEEENKELSDSKELAIQTQIVESGFFVDLNMDEEEEEEHHFDGSVIPPSKETPPPDEMPTILMLFKSIKQLSHPDKIMRFSADDKRRLMDVFLEAKKFYEDDNIDALAFCYVQTCLIRNEPQRIYPAVAKYVIVRKKQIDKHIAFIMQKPFMPAIIEWAEGNFDNAVELFKQYLYAEKLQKKPIPESEMDDEDYFA